MPRSRSRSRSRRDRRGDDRGGRDERREERKEGVAEAAKSGSSEQEIVSVAIRQLPGDIRERLEKLFEEGLLKEGDLDLRSITVFASLNEGLQARVMNHMENERIYVANARSKSGFLIATCDKAKTGCLDARGLGAIDPWRTALVAMATPKQKMVELKPERDWLEKHDEGAAIKLHVNVGIVESELGVPSVTVELPLSETSAAVKAKLVAMGVRSIPANRMKLHTDPVGFLKEGHSFAFYNLSDGATLALSERKRAGVRLRSDHTAMPKRPRTQPAPGEAAAAPADALSKLVNSPKFPALPNLPKLPGLPGLAGTLPATGLPGLPLQVPMTGGTAPAMAGAGTAPGAAPGGAAAMAALLQGMRPPQPGGMTLPAGMTLPGGMTLPAGMTLPGGMQMPGTGAAPQLGALGGLALPKMPTIDPKAMPPMPGLLGLTGPAGGLAKAPPLFMPGADPKANPPLALMGDMAKAKAALLTPDTKAPGLTMPPSGGLGMPAPLDPKNFALPGTDPKAAALAMMAKMGGLPLSMPTPGNMSKAPGGLPMGLPGGLPGSVPAGPPDMTMPPMDMAAPKVQSKSQMPSIMSGAIPKVMAGAPGLPPTGLGSGPPPAIAEAVAAATAKAAAPA